MALAVDHVEDHALAVNVGELQPDNLGAAHTGAVENGQKCALEKTAAGLDQVRHLFPAEDVGQLPLHLGIGKKLIEPAAAKRVHEKEAQRGYMVLDRSW